MESPSAFLVVDPERRFVDASPEALELFGVDLATLRAMRVGDFTVVSERRTVLAAFETMVSTRDEGLIGEADIVRPDGRELRIHFTTAPHPEQPGHYLTVVRRLGEPADEVRIRTGAQVLAEWRKAEREAAHQSPGTSGHHQAMARVDTLRLEYQEVTRRRSADW